MEEMKMKRMRRAVMAVLLPAAAACVAGGCLSVKTEHEIKPIHITMDVNLKVQKELENFLNLE
jgi:uncharacterized membrane protein